MRRDIKLGISALLVSALLSGVIVLAADAQNDEQNCTTVVCFDGMTENRTNISNQSELTIPSSIKRYDIIVLNLTRLDGLLKVGAKVPIHIEGNPYVMALNEIKVNAPGIEEGTHSYSGSIVGIKDSEIVMIFSDRVLVGSIIMNDVEYTIESLGKRETIQTERVLHVVYSSKDVVAEGGTVLIDYNSSVPETKNNSTNLKDNLQNLNVVTQGTVNIGILVATDNKWVTDEPDWMVKAQNIMAEANNQLTRDDIQVQLIVNLYDDSKKSELSNDPNIISAPLQTFYNHFPPSYLDSKSADIAIYLGGYNSTAAALGASWGYDFGAPKSRYAWAQMADGR